MPGHPLSRALGALLACVVPFHASLSAERNLEQETTTLTRANEQVSMLGTDLFGDSISTYNGALSFLQTDVSIPGNSSLPVSVSRRFLGVSEMETLGTSYGLFGDWDLDLPRIEGTFSLRDGWVVDAGLTARCTFYDKPRQVAANNPGDGSFYADEFFSGVHMYLPGRGSQELLRRNETSPVPNDGNAYPLTTLDRTLIRCLTNLPHGEGFEALTPDGTRYRFDWLVNRPARGLGKPPHSGLPDLRRAPGPVPNVSVNALLSRVHAEMRPTLVTDRFGHTVQYNWNAAIPEQLLSIVADDGRTLTFTYYDGTRRIHTVTHGNRTWTYTYTGHQLLTAARPDGSAWSFALGPLFFNEMQYPEQGSTFCDGSSPPISGLETGTMTHPSGATASFTVRPRRHARTNVPNFCNQILDDPPTVRWVNRYPLESDVYSIESKTISGPGLQPMTWNYTYSAPTPCWRQGAANPHGAPICTANTPKSKTVTIEDPEGRFSQHTYSTEYGINEGKLLKLEVGPLNNWKSVSNFTYAVPGTPGKLYPDPIGTSIVERQDVDAATRFKPQESKVEVVNGVTLTWSGNAFDAFGSPTSVTRTSSTGLSKQETITYQHYVDDWVLGLPLTVTNPATGLVEATYTYDEVPGSNTKLLKTKTIFGRLDETRSYYTSGLQKGLLATRKDAADKVTTYANYKRGIPQAVTFHDGSGITGTVSDEGWVKTYTDELVNTTTYDYDSLGRLTSVVHPAGDTVAWASTTISFAKQGASPFNLPNNLWKQSVTTGNYAKDTYFDALWRPILIRERDITAGSSDRFTVREFDADGREVFTSYPVASAPDYTAINSGTRKTFDDLGRLYQTIVDSELGPLTTTVDYIGGVNAHTKRITNPRGFQTEIDFMVYDEASEELPLEIRAPENTKIVFDRDAYGKPKSITRSGTLPVVTATRRYVYDANQRLCKVIDPERGAEVIAYDSANRIDWSAPGTNLTADFSNCQQANVQPTDKIVRSYDARNRLLGVDYPGDTLDEVSTYWPDGALKTVARGSGLAEVKWTYTYNKRRLLEQEGTSIDGNDPNLAYTGWTYNSLGHVDRLKYINGHTVEFAPNALGQATVVRTPDLSQIYAHSVSYHPNGALAGFTYGNNVVHTTTQNTRDLPGTMSDVGSSTLLSYTHTYDQNGNPTVISDGVAGAPDSKTLTYDDLDRLESATALGTFGSATMQYDALDNLLKYQVGSRDYRYVINATTQRLDRINNAVGSQLIGYQYDARGNTTQKNQTGNNLAFAFDRTDRLTEVKRNNAVIAAYRYDGNGRRIKTVRPDGDFRYQFYSQGGQYLWDANFDEDAPNNRINVTAYNYIYLQGRLIAKRKTYDETPRTEDQLPLFEDGFETLLRTPETVAPQAMAKDGPANPFAPRATTVVSVQFVHVDALGSPIAESDIAGNLIGSRSYYEPYGQPLSIPIEGQPSYTGHQYDASTGLIQAQQRFYDPATGNFISPDSKEVDVTSADNFNRFGYGSRSPFKYFDPDGRDVVIYARDAGEGMTNFGHTAVRVSGEGYDVTFDFGRYRNSWGFLKSQGEGVLRVWRNPKAFEKTQSGKGDLIKREYKTSAKFDRSVIRHFLKQIQDKETKTIERTSDRTSYVLPEQYELQTNNCTTQSLEAIDNAERETGETIEDLESLKGENDPRDVHDELTEGGE